MTESVTVGVVIVAAGRGTRAGNAECPKTYRQIAGETVIARVIRAFRSWDAHCPIVVVYNRDDRILLENAAQHLKDRNVHFQIGGDTRPQSVSFGLSSLALIDDLPSHVMIHDAARPFISRAVLDRVRDSLVESPNVGVIPGIPVADTLKKADANGLIFSTVSREGLYRAQTPQAFPYNTILDLHTLAGEKGVEYTDDAALFEQAGLPVRVIQGEERNFKLTYEADFEQAERMLKAEQEEEIPSKVLPPSIPDIRVGHGYDTHKLIPGENITLCGVTIPHKASLLGHSDADAGLHALTNALLGAISAEDIGYHFSPADARWKDASSDRFLQHAGNLVSQAGGVLTHCDVSIICEKPKISPHREAMRDRIAGILGVDRSRVSVKAGTNEKNGFVGREEGIVAFATATVFMHPKE